MILIGYVVAAVHVGRVVGQDQDAVFTFLPSVGWRVIARVVVTVDFAHD